MYVAHSDQSGYGGASVAEMQHSTAFWHERSRPPLNTVVYNLNANTLGANSDSAKCMRRSPLANDWRVQ